MLRACVVPGVWAASVVATMVVVLSVRAQADMPASGTWGLSAVGRDAVEVKLAARSGGSSWVWRESLALADLRGLSTSQLTGSGGAHFAISRDAGTFDCQGQIDRGQGQGLFVFQPSVAFADALAQSAIQRPTASEQLQLALDNVTLSMVNALRKAGYHLSASDLLRLTDHGVTAAYVDALARSHSLPSSVDDLVRLRDHGVQPDFLATVQSAGMSVSADDAVALVDHGVTAQYVRDIRRLGYTPTVDQLVRLVDHGVTTAWIKQLQAQGLHPSVSDLIRMRDAGV